MSSTNTVTNAISAIPKYIAIDVGYANRVYDSDKYTYNETLKERLNEEEDTYKLITSIPGRNYDTDSWILLEYTDDRCNYIGQALYLVDMLGEINFCACCGSGNVTDIRLSPDVIELVVNTESG